MVHKALNLAQKVFVWLFGSRDRGERREDSDVDLLVITRGDPARDRRAIQSFFVQELDRGVVLFGAP